MVEGPTGESGSGPVNAPERIGPYRILGEIGQGGFGTVYAAEEDEPRRRVALKVIKLGMDTREVLARFDAERQALARMNHTNIAKVFSAGATDTGQPYFAMEYVAGLPLTEYCDDRKSSIEQRIELFLRVCEGVQHAHQKGVIHRDLKPSNVMVAEEGDRPVPKIIDFGLARATDHHLTAATLFTQEGRMIGTPEYMSPEQAGLSRLDIDTRTDIYSLGVILYELLVGELPFPTRMLQDAGYAEMERKIREDDPDSPSTRISRLGERATYYAELRGLARRELGNRLSRDLDWITMKALEKDRVRRYATPTALAEDLERYLSHRPVMAGPPATIYRFRKWLRRHKASVGAGVLAFAVLLIGFVVSLLLFFEAREAKRRVELAADPILLREYLQEVVDLHPALSGRIPAMDDWLADASLLVARLEDHRRYLTELGDELAAVRARAERQDASQVEADEIARLQFAHLHQREFVDRLSAFGAAGGAIDDVRRLRDLASSVANFESATAWDEARAAIAASSRYGELVLANQEGLYPLGLDLDSGLYEFVHLLSGEPPERRDGKLVLTPATGIVLVLVPGGTFRMGAQGEDPSGSGYEEGATDREGLPFEAELGPFFLSKYEVTQAQWRRMTGHNPSKFLPTYGDAAVRSSWLNPVENLNWETCNRVLGQWDLMLPTEAQWEYACRARTTTPWSSKTLESLDEYANLADRSVEKIESWARDDRLDDGFLITAPVGSLRANLYGLHDMHGNVFEFCRDAYVATYEKGVRGADSELIGGAPERRCIRGGCFISLPITARSSYRLPRPIENKHETYGVRPARPIRL